MLHVFLAGQIDGRALSIHDATTAVFIRSGGQAYSMQCINIDWDNIDLLYSL
jgi:hypothetical protein